MAQVKKPKIDWTQPIEFDDGTPVELVRTDGRYVLIRAYRFFRNQGSRGYPYNSWYNKASGTMHGMSRDTSAFRVVNAGPEEIEAWRL